MASKIQRYREALRLLGDARDWELFLLEHSALPGPRANLELLAAVVEEAAAEILFALIEKAPPVAGPSPDPRLEFLAACGAAGVGRLLAEGDQDQLPLLSRLAGDPRWRVREGVAMALQRLGDQRPEALLTLLRDWSRGNRLEQRAVVAGICEPRLLSSPVLARECLALLDAITASVVAAGDRKEGEFRILRQALAYGWSVAAVADLQGALPLLEKWLVLENPDVRWIMKQNLGKARLRRAAPDWVAAWRPQV